MERTKSMQGRARPTLILVLGLAAAAASAADLQVFHADSLAGPMREVKKAFEAEATGSERRADLRRIAPAGRADHQGRRR